MKREYMAYRTWKNYAILSAQAIENAATMTGKAREIAIQRAATLNGMAKKCRFHSKYMERLKKETGE